MSAVPRRLHPIIRILDALAEYGPAQAGQLATRLGMPVTVIHAWLRRLDAGSIVCVLTYARAQRGRGARIWDLHDRLGEPPTMGRTRPKGGAA